MTFSASSPIHTDRRTYGQTDIKVKLKDLVSWLDVSMTFRVSGPVLKLKKPVYFIKGNKYGKILGRPGKTTLFMIIYLYNKIVVQYQ